MSRCDDKAVTHSLLDKHGIRVPRQRVAQSRQDSETFLQECGSLVVKPAQGEQGRGVHVDVRETGELEAALDDVAKTCPKVVLEEYVEGQDLRVVVIDYRVVAGAIRRPAQVTGTGRHTINALIEKQSRRRAAATAGESSIPIDEETKRCLALQDLNLGDILAEGRSVPVRKTANLHTGGTLHDVTGELSQALRDASERAAKVLNIPVVGLDFIVDSAESDDYVLIEANERPGLANHEPQPTAERFVDLLFPQTAAESQISRHQEKTAL